jgi:hypothetical protein
MELAVSWSPSAGDLYVNVLKAVCDLPPQTGIVTWDTHEGRLVLSLDPREGGSINLYPITETVVTAGASIAGSTPPLPWVLIPPFPDSSLTPHPTSKVHHHHNIRLSTSKQHHNLHTSTHSHLQHAFHNPHTLHRRPLRPHPRQGQQKPSSQRRQPRSRLRRRSVLPP